MKRFILCVALVLVMATSLDAAPKIYTKKRLFSRVVIINGIKIRITRPLFRRRNRIVPIEQPQTLPLELDKTVPIPLYDFTNRLKDLA